MSRDWYAWGAFVLSVGLAILAVAVLIGLVATLAGRGCVS